MVVPNICGCSVKNMLCVTLLEPRLLENLYVPGIKLEDNILKLFCTMTNKCTINGQIIALLLHVSTLLYHPQGVRS